MMRVLSLARQAGCKFTCGTDAHKMADFDKAYLCAKMADDAGITEQDLYDFSKWEKGVHKQAVCRDAAQCR